MTDKPKFKNPFVEMARAAQEKKQQQFPNNNDSSTVKSQFNNRPSVNKPPVRHTGRGR